MPRGVLAATAALNMSPVAKWHKQYSSFMTGDWVPFPDPGGPALKYSQAQHCTYSIAVLFIICTHDELVFGQSKYKFMTLK